MWEVLVKYYIPGEEENKLMRIEKHRSVELIGACMSVLFNSMNIGK